MSTTLVPDATALERLQIIQTAESVALVGVSADPIRSSNFVAAYLVRTPFRIYMVNPAYEEVLGMKAYPSLAELPEVPDVVIIFRRRDAIPGVVDEFVENTTLGRFAQPVKHRVGGDLEDPGGGANTESLG